MDLMAESFPFLISFETASFKISADLDTCLEYSEKIKIQDLHQRVAGDKIYIKVYCVPKGGEKK